MSKLELLRVDFAMAALVRDEKGDVVEEIQVATGRAYPGQLDQFPKELRDTFKRAQEEWAKQEQAATPKRTRAKTNKDGRAPKRAARKR